MFKHIAYQNLTPRQKESYNFQKIAARLADYGFICLWITDDLRPNDDYQGVDFIAHHIDGKIFLKVQLTRRLAIDKKYIGKGIHIAFRYGTDCYIYDHDALVSHLEANGLIGAGAKIWHKEGRRSWPKPPSWANEYLAGYTKI